MLSIVGSLAAPLATLRFPLVTIERVSDIASSPQSVRSCLAGNHFLKLNWYNFLETDKNQVLAAPLKSKLHAFSVHCMVYVNRMDFSQITARWGFYK